MDLDGFRGNETPFSEKPNGDFGWGRAGSAERLEPRFDEMPTLYDADYWLVVWNIFFIFLLGIVTPTD